MSGCGKGDAPTSPDTASAAPLASVSADPLAGAPVVLAFGDSLYAGYQLKPGESYPAKLQAALAARGVRAKFVNAGVSGDTTAAGLERLAFTLDNQPVKPVLVMVGLGGNDMLRGLPPEQTRQNLTAILAELKKRHLPAMLTGMLAAPNMGADYVAKFNPIYPALANTYHAPLVPFLLQPIFTHPELKLADGIHPNAAGVDRIVVATVDQVEKALKAAEKGG
nr:arylesterase [Novosphingobium lentum]